MKRIALALVLLIAAAANAQEFDIFEISDFVDPRLRGTEYGEDGLRTVTAGYPFLVSRVSVGAIRDYYWRTAPTGANVAVFHDVTSFYWGANQLNLKLTHLRTQEDDSIIPKSRGVLQYARYTARTQPAGENEEEPSVFVSRYMVGLAVEESPDALEDLKGHRSVNYELAAELDVRLPLTGILGTISYVKRYAGESYSTQRFAYVLHSGLYNYRGVRFDMNLAFGAQKTETWRWGDLRPTFHARVPLDKVGTVVHLAYSPTISFEGGFDHRHEVALFLDRAIFARVFMPRDAEE